MKWREFRTQPKAPCLQHLEQMVDKSCMSPLPYFSHPLPLPTSQAAVLEDPSCISAERLSLATGGR
jgi:hypothetical protein